MTAPAYPASYYAATAQALALQPPLSGEASCDVCIIGGGYTGLSAALHLAERGYQVILLEAERIGWGASGRNGGQLGSGQRKDQRTLEKMLGTEWAQRLWALALEGKKTVQSLIAQHKIECDLTPGILQAAWKASDIRWMQEEAEHMHRAYGYEGLRFVPRDEMHSMVASTSYHAGLLDTGGAHLHPLNFCLGLAQACLAKGVKIYEGSRVERIEEGATVVLRTSLGSVTAKHVVLAANAYLGKLEPRIAGTIMPINNFIIATEPLGERRARALIRDNVGVQDTKFVIDYYRLSADHRLLFGGGENYSAQFPKDIAGFVREPMLRVFPQLKDVRIDYAWGGTLAITMKRLPQLGRTMPNIYFAHGYSGQGLNMATLAGKLIAEAIADQMERFDWMAKIKTPRFPGGILFRYPLMVAGMLFYAMRDRLP